MAGEDEKKETGFEILWNYTHSEFSDEFNAAAKRILPQLEVVDELLNGYEGLVEECEEGYSWELCELMNEIYVRYDLEIAISSQALQSFPELKIVKEKTSALDERYKRLLIPDMELYPGRPWWEQSFPRYGRGFLVDSVRDMQGFKVIDQGEDENKLFIKE